MRDEDLWYPYDNDPEPKRYTVALEAKIYSYVDVEATDIEDLKIEIDYLNKKEILDGVEDIEVIKANTDDYDGKTLFNYDDEDRLRKRIKELEQEIKELKENKNEE